MKKDLSCRGFSLVELLVVICIIGILSAVSIPAYLSHIDSVRRDDAKQILLALKTSQEMFFALNDRYNNTINGLEGYTPDGGGYIYSSGQHWRFKVTAGNDSAFTAIAEGGESYAEETWRITAALLEPEEI